MFYILTPFTSSHIIIIIINKGNSDVRELRFSKLLWRAVATDFNSLISFWVFWVSNTSDYHVQQRNGYQIILPGQKLI